jgi:hypothetical protein
MERPQSSPMGRGGPSFFFLISEYNTIEFDGSPVSSTLVTTTEIWDSTGAIKVSVPSPMDLAWDVCSMTHLETHFPMH